MKNRFACAFLLTIGIAACAQASIVSLNAPVTLNGSYPTFSAVCGPSPQPAASTIDNGVFQPETTCYQSGIHWQGATTGDTTHTIAISFSSASSISGAIVQADDNDTYELDYLGLDNLYHLWWSIPTISSFGLVTRPNADQTTVMSLPTVSALGVRIWATGGDGDYAVSQVEVFSGVPEPGTLGILSAGLLAFGTLVYRKRKSL